MADRIPFSNRWSRPLLADRNTALASVCLIDGRTDFISAAVSAFPALAEHMDPFSLLLLHSG